MMKYKKHIGIGLGAATLIVLLAYTIFWFWAASNIRKIANDFISDSKQKQVYILPDSLAVKGFPFEPEIHFTGQIRGFGYALSIPKIVVQSTFLPGDSVTILAPKGLGLAEHKEQGLWSLDELQLDVLVPESLPEAMTREDLTKWRHDGQKLVLEDIFLRKEMLNVQGSGNISLDAALQPTGSFQVSVNGHMKFLRWMQVNDYIETREAMLSTAVLSGLSKIDEKTNESYMDILLTLQNQTLFLGPLRLAYLPAIRWGWRSGPGLLE